MRDSSVEDVQVDGETDVVQFMFPLPASRPMMPASNGAYQRIS
jgi:hypothetical protein